MPPTPLATSAARLDSSTADYHNNLENAARQRHLPSASSAHWKLSGAQLSGANCQRDETPPLSVRELQEYNSLPIAVRRKFFSALERSRFAGGSGVLQHMHPSVPAAGTRNDRLDVELSPASELCSDGSSFVSGKLAGPLPHACLPEAAASANSVSRPQPCAKGYLDIPREEQLRLARQLRESVLLDVADEAANKPARQPNRQPVSSASTTYSLTPSPTGSMEFSAHEDRASHLDQTRESLYDSFRWLDEEEDLDLSLSLDDYHGNLREGLPELNASFRRHLSVSKMPFGSGPIHGPVTPASPTSTSSSIAGNARRKSRTLSLMARSAAEQEAMASFDPDAAHYQNPEARLKLRAYLSSPQKFDEALMLGFQKDVPCQGQGRVQTFLSDDNSSILSDDEQSCPDTPATPQTPGELAVRSHPSCADEQSRAMESRAQTPPSTREMTLRMTLTRPDLRSSDYEWQQGPSQQQQRCSSQPRDFGSNVCYVGDHRPNHSLDKFFGNLDHVEHTPAEGKVKKRLKNLFTQRR